MSENTSIFGSTKTEAAPIYYDKTSSPTMVMVAHILLSPVGATFHDNLLGHVTCMNMYLHLYMNYCENWSLYLCRKSLLGYVLVWSPLSCW